VGSIFDRISCPTGYRSGVADFLDDPDEMMLKLVNQVASSAGAQSALDPKHPLALRLRNIGERIISSAQKHCEEQYEKSKVDTEATEIDKEAWASALRRIGGRWNFIVLDTHTPNAFVSPLIPRNIFIHEGLITAIDPSDEEIALILAHEISHVIHNHGNDQSLLKGMLAMFQLIAFVFVDPTGTWFYLFDIAIAQLSTYIEAAYSRESETEADLTGIQIAAKACYETRGAGKVFLKFAEYKGESGDDTSWGSSHPADAHRHLYVEKESEVHNPENHRSVCGEMEVYLKQFRKAMLKKEMKRNKQAEKDE
jgi:Zn-dependent protease with chaperone function